MRYARTMRQRIDGGPVNIDAAELDFARERLSRGESVRVVHPQTGRVYLCTTLDEVRDARAGKVPAGATRLDGKA